MMQCVEQLLEAKIVAAIEALDLPWLTVFGRWDLAGAETPGTVSALTVTVAPRSYSRFTVCEATFSVSLDLNFRLDADVDGARFHAAVAAVTTLLHTWNMNKHNEAKLALSVTDILAIGGVRVGGGEAPFIDREAGTRSVSFTFEAVGFIKHTLTTGD